MKKIPVGSLRPSQLLWTYGPGALIDLPNLSVITMGLDRWDVNRCPLILESRLLEQVRRVLGPQVEHLRMPPVVHDEDVDPFSPQAKIGVPVRPFPRWLRCVRCGLLASYDSSLFEIRENPYRPDKTEFLHTSCEKGSKSDAVPARFMVACRNGHIDDFPWHWYVHRGASNCKGTLRFFEAGASLQTENLWVKCDECGSSRSLVHAFGAGARDNLPACRGRHPHLDHFEPDCREDARTVLLGSTNSWFAVTVSVLAIPTTDTSLSQLISDGWANFKPLKSEANVEIILGVLTANSLLPGIERYSANEVWDAVEQHRSGSTPSCIEEEDVKRPEWEVLTHPNPPTDWPFFLSERVEPPQEYGKVINEVLILTRLREVNALIGYTRVDAPERSADQDEDIPMAPLSLGKTDWVPATEVHGEGIFIRFDEEMLKVWEELPAVKAREENLYVGHQGWRNARSLRPNEGFPGIRYVMLHTLAHLLIREFALECGYNAASIRERLFAVSGDEPMAGILLYTASADSDGTLGGLVELGKPENLGRLIQQALQRATVCSSDPLCSEHDPGKDRSLHSAACHACLFVSETSCEMGNRYLDRALLVPTFDSSDSAFFKPNGGRTDG